ncbi:MAG: glycosyltransferase family 4 protein [Pseudomonadota bacterium]
MIHFEGDAPVGERSVSRRFRAQWSVAKAASKGWDVNATPDRRPLTILQLTPELNAGGVERGTLEIAQAVAAAGGRALVASAGGRLMGRLAGVGAEGVTLPLASKNPATLLLNARRLARLITREGVDIVHARSRAPAWSGLWAAERAGARFMTTYHGAYSESFPGKRAYNEVMARGDPVIAISHFIAELVMERHQTPPERLRVIPRGADLSVFNEARTTGARVAALANQWGVADDPRTVVLLPGRLTRWKGQTLFVEALALLKTRLGADAFQGVIVGGGAAEAPMGRFERELRAQIAAADLGDVVRLVGHCDDMPAAYQLSGYAVSASLEPEAFGRVAVEAQAMGVPVIAAAHGGALETVAAGETGWVFEPGSAEALADALAEALEQSREARRTMGLAAEARVRRRFSTEAMQNATLAVYAEAAGRGF